MITSEEAPIVCIIIVTFNGEDWIGNCLKTLKMSSGVELNIIVVDNASTDNTLQIITTFHKDVILLEQKQNLGFGRANNIGIKYAIEILGVENIFLLNQDTTIEDENSLRRLIKVLNTNPSYGIISPIHLNDFGSDFDYMFKDYVISVPALSEFNKTFFASKEEIFEVPFINAAAWLLKGETIKCVGLFNPIFPHYGEDNDYINRIHKLGKKVGVTTAGTIRHLRFERSLTHKKTTFAKDVQRQYIVALIMLNNVSYNFTRALKIFIRYQLAVLFDSIRKYNWRQMKIICSVLLKVTLNFPSILSNRSHRLP